MNLIRVKCFLYQEEKMVCQSRAVPISQSREELPAQEMQLDMPDSNLSACLPRASCFLRVMFLCPVEMFVLYSF